MKTLITTVSAAILGFSSLSFGHNAYADTFSISVADGSFSYSDDEYSDTGYSEIPIVIVQNDWSPPPAYYRRHHDRGYWHHSSHRGHKHHKRHHGHYKRHRRHHR